MGARVGEYKLAYFRQHVLPIVALSDLYLRALRVLRGSNLAFLCALRVSVVSKSIYGTLVSRIWGAGGIGGSCFSLSNLYGLSRETTQKQKKRG